MPSGGGQTSIAIGTIDALERGGVVRSSAQQEMMELYIDSCSYWTTEENWRGRISVQLTMETNGNGSWRVLDGSTSSPTCTMIGQHG